MKTLFVPFALALSLAVVGCGSSFRAAHRTTIDPATHTHRTYALQQTTVNRGELDDLIAQSMHDVMRARGYERAASADEADLLVTYGVVLSDPRRDPNEAVMTSDLSTNPDAPVRTKTLVVQLHDARTRDVIWLGVSTTSAVDSELRAHAEEILADLRDRIPEAARQSS